MGVYAWEARFNICLHYIASVRHPNKLFLFMLVTLRPFVVHLEYRAATETSNVNSTETRRWTIAVSCDFFPVLLDGQTLDGVGLWMGYTNIAGNIYVS